MRSAKKVRTREVSSATHLVKYYGFDQPSKRVSYSTRKGIFVNFTNSRQTAS